MEQTEPPEIQQMKRMLDSPEMNDAIEKALKGALVAKRTRWDKAKKQMIQEDDIGTQVRAVEILLSYKLGDRDSSREKRQKVGINTSNARAREGLT